MGGTEQKAQGEVSGVRGCDHEVTCSVVQPLHVYDFLEMKTESAEEVITALTDKWLAVFPKPKVLLMDSAKSFGSDDFHEFARSLNIRVHYIAEKEH